MGINFTICFVDSNFNETIFPSLSIEISTEQKIVFSIIQEHLEKCAFKLDEPKIIYEKLNDIYQEAKEF